jgi:hypothetical protein
MKLQTKMIKKLTQTTSKRQNVLSFFAGVIVVTVLIMITRKEINTTPASMCNVHEIPLTRNVNDVVGSTIRVVGSVQANTPSHEQLQFHNHQEFVHRHPIFQHFVMPPNHSNQYTYHFCVNGDLPEAYENVRELRSPEWYKRQCVFRNLGWDGSQFVYHIDPNHPPIWDFPSGGEQNKPQTTLDPQILKDSVFRRDPKLFTAFKFSSEPITSASYPVHGEKSSDDVVHIYASRNQIRDCKFYSGHDLADEIWPIFNLMINTRTLGMNNVLLLSVKCEALRYPAGSKFWEIFAKDQVFLPDIEKKPRVFSLLAAGDGSRTLFSPTFPIGFLATLFRDYAYESFNITPADRSLRRCKIVVVKKSPRHRFLNHEEIIQYLNQHYNNECDILSISPELMTAREEILVMSNTDIFLTPGGGASFGSVFLRDGAVAIYGNVCWPGTAPSRERTNGQDEFSKDGSYLYCIRSDNHLWNMFPHFHKRYIGPATMKPSEVVYDDVNAVHHNNPFFDFSYKLNMANLKNAMDEALAVVKDSSVK